MSRKHVPSSIDGRTHEYHADAVVLSGDLHLPLKQPIDPQVEAHLYKDGGYLSEHSDVYRLEGVIRFSRAYSQVSGNVGRKPGHGWATLTTTVVENLNILEILTCDRIVGQIITEYPLVGYVPTISFLGTRFENLRIAGHPLKVDLDINILGDKPDGDRPYASHMPVLDRVKEQYETILGHEDLPAELRNEYNQLSSKLGDRKRVPCTLVRHVSGSFPGHHYHNVLKIPDFGTVKLATLEVTHDEFDPDEHHKPDPEVPKVTTVNLTMLDLKLGCPIDGQIGVGSGNSNGKTMP